MSKTILFVFLVCFVLAVVSAHGEPSWFVDPSWPNFVSNLFFSPIQSWMRPTKSRMLAAQRVRPFLTFIRQSFHLFLSNRIPRSAKRFPNQKRSSHYWRASKRAWFRLAYEVLMNNLSMMSLKMVLDHAWVSTSNPTNVPSLRLKIKPSFSFQFNRLNHQKGALPKRRE